MWLSTFKRKVKSLAFKIKPRWLQSGLMYLLRRANECHLIYKDLLCQFKEVKLYRKQSTVDFEKQWEARANLLFPGNVYSQYHNNASDPDALDESSVRKDDAFMLEYLPAGCSVLELGCGNGRLGQLLTKKKNIRYLGLEYSKTAVEIARGKGLEVYECDINDLNHPAFEKIKGKRFDYVISIWVLDLLKNQEELIPMLFNFTTTQLHGFWNAGHWSSRLRLLFGRFPIYNFNLDKEGHLIYPYIYGLTNRAWTLKDFRAYAQELGYCAQPIGVGPKFGTYTAMIFKKMFWSSMRAGRVIFKITALNK